MTINSKLPLILQSADTEPEQGRELHVHQLHRDRAQPPPEAPALRELPSSEVAEGIFFIINNKHPMKESSSSKTFRP